MTFLHRVPSPPLDAFVELLWFYSNEPGPNRLERVLPNGTAQLIVNLKEDQTRVYLPESGRLSVVTRSGTILSGIRTRYQIIDKSEQECVAGVCFRPGGTTPFFRAPATESLDADIPLDAFWGARRTAELREQLLEAPGPEEKLDVLECALAANLAPTVPHPAVAYALRAFGHTHFRDGGIAEITSRVGLSPKRFIERFKADVGVPPKRYCRILRFQRALGHAEAGRLVDWTRVAQDCGYFDQAHFIHDFRAFAGITPGAYQTARTEFRNHVKFLQSDCYPA